MTDQATAPKVFLSYSWSSPEHERWVLELAERLTADGVYVILDKWELREGHDLYAFMEQMITKPEVSKVLVISDQIYADKADGRLGGVGTETQIISQEVYDKVNQEKFIPIVTEYNAEGKPFLPIFLRNRVYIDFSSPQRQHEEYERLIRAIYNKPLFTRPTIGTPPTYLLEGSRPASQTTYKFRSFQDAVRANKPFARGLLREYLLAFEQAVSAEVQTSGEDQEVPDEAVVSSIERLLPYRNEYVDLIIFLASFTEGVEQFREVHESLGRLLHVLGSSETRQSSGRTTDSLRFLLWEMFLYLTASLIQENRFEAAALFLEEPYFVSAGRYSERSALRSFEVFDTYIRSLEEVRKRRLELQFITVAGHLLEQRANHTRVSFEHLIEADFLLAIRNVFYPHEWSTWYPRLLVYAEYHEVFPLFLRAESSQFFARMMPLLGVNSREDFQSRVQKVVVESRFPRVEQFWGGNDRYLRLMNFERIGIR